MAFQGIMDSSTGKPVNRLDRKDLAYQLFIELLSYQLASPVRWIETQHHLLQKASQVHRFIEIGPRTTLARMARRSAAVHHSHRVPSQWSHLQFLSYQDDQAKVLYEYSDSATAVSVSKPLVSAAGLVSTGIAPESRALSSASAPPCESSHAPSASVSLSARHVVLALTAQKLRRPFDQVPMDKTIRDLSGGKSTLQNELIGDLVAEFGRVPEGVEDMSLMALAEALRGGFPSKPAQKMSALISKFVSSKMPAGFHQSSAQDYLQSQWGLDKTHSIVVICFATTVEPLSRLENSDAARAFFDDLVARYAAFEGISMVPVGGTNNAGALIQSTVVDAAGLDALRKEQRDFHHKQLDLLARHLQIETGLPTAFLSDERLSLEEKLEQWNAEFDDRFLEGIRSIFNLKQVRHYDSWWNWAREDLIQWLHEVSESPVSIAIQGMDDRLRRILNRWEPTCTDIVTARLQRVSQQTRARDLSRIRCLRPVLNEIMRLGMHAQSADPVYIHTHAPLEPITTLSDSGRQKYDEVVRRFRSYPDVVRRGRTAPATAEIIPFVHIKTRGDEESWKYNAEATELLHTTMDVGVSTGYTYSGRAVLVTGAGPDSIGAEIIQGLLAGGAHVVVTTSRAVCRSAGFYQWLFRRYGARGASLTLLPMNQASKKDCEALIEYIFSPDSPTGGDLDFIVPFAAIPQTGEPDNLGSRQELALRAMLVNLLRLVGLVRREKEKRRIDTRPTMVILPMSCNEGTFGGDGLYPESKIGLKTLFNRFHSESWSTYITVCGAVIGWTRGTGLMRSSNMVAAEMEKLGVITFSQAEMAFNILTLMTPTMVSLAEETPVYADLTGGFGAMWNIKEHITSSRERLAKELRLRKALAEEEAHHETTVQGQPAPPKLYELKPRVKRANIAVGFPSLTSHQELTAGLLDLHEMIDLSHTVVVVGFSELGPWGSSRTRWEMEHQGRFSLEGYVEMSWMMGLIKHVDGELNGKPYVGWIDAETREPVRDDEIPRRYDERIISNSGLRLIQPDTLDSYDPSRKEFMHEVAVEDDLPPFESSKSVAEAFKLRHGDNVNIQPIPGSEDYRVSLMKGAVVMIPKAVPFHQVVGGRIPKGWDPLRYGIPEDIVQQVDLTTMYALCCVAEAFLSAGIKDPYEIYQHIHISELANCLGTGGGPMKIIKSMYRDRYLDRPVRGDIILDHFLNTMGAWVNMLLLSSTGPLKTPVGACATAIESLDSGCEAIQSGRCKVAIVGGCDDYSEVVAYEFASIQATANSTEELAKGRLPSEISRPTASSRSGFAESAGCGAQILMTAELALQMGLPIYGIVAYNQLASDQVGRSIPAPGKGILTAGRESPEARDSPLLDFHFRRRRFNDEVAQIQNQWRGGRLATTCQPAEAARQRTMEQTANLRVREAQRRWANDIRLQDPSISPIKAALATWGLTIDDIDVASMHGTSTKANEINEGAVINLQMSHLGRRNGNPLLCVCQKSLTGHPKAAAGAWQLNGCMQMFRDSIVPGNRNADNVDGQLRQFEHLVYLMEPIRGAEVKATMLTSFGFGQKGALTLMIAPRYLFAAVSGVHFEEYRARVTRRQRTANPEFVGRLLKNSLVQVKSEAPWKGPEALQSVSLNHNSRLNVDQSVFIHKPHAERQSTSVTSESKPMADDGKSTMTSVLTQTLLESLTRESACSSTSVGVDVEEIMGINIENQTFIHRNFTSAEREYCSNSPNPRASYAGRWSAKEAVFKSLQTPSVGAGAAMNEIEILQTKGIPNVLLHGNAQAIAASKGISSIEVTISHSAGTAIAVALAMRGPSGRLD
ncbi:hypothetical protein BO70DRAFT_430530 [Aspergillus heteromorphus CBS 117.55]|uniref:Fatty acid synthase subunit alpha n=1 Tax=Aspergillus heteromorphus CBS 117.55 TaxID=1448321 RepID=A0A317VTV1_9EURO|nr:uncharacterized protein BO70DRAFT_430530 [Aspergillus heteromorphus CBS 117.55]PWY77009.1 hypothetical protein BO70DRAFT_430530 [Aspergillus heteromorphus CBS 117.55]